MNNINVYHLLRDEIWIEGAIRMFDDIDSINNNYIYIEPIQDKSLKHINNIDNLDIVQVDEIGSYLESVPHGSIVFVHSLSNYHANIVNKYHNKYKFVWLIMGADMYQNKYIYDKNIYDEYTYQLKPCKKRRIGILKKIYWLFKYKSFNYLDHQKVNIAKAAKKIKYVGTYQQEQLDLLQSLDAVDNEAMRFHFAYYPLEYIIKDDNPEITGFDILLGNSASCSNNHIEAINILSGLDNIDGKIYCPLSYGDMEYADKIIEYGKKKLGNTFEPIEKLLPLEEYNQILSKCNIVVMNHYRGQASGNILSALYRGSKVFMNPKSTIYRYLKNKGVYVYNIYNINRNDEHTYDIVVNNRNILRDEISSESIKNSIKHNINLINNHDINKINS